jgi:hypothetical protein
MIEVSADAIGGRWGPHDDDDDDVFLTCDPPFFWVLKPTHRCFLKTVPGVFVLNKFLRGEIAESFVAV